MATPTTVPAMLDRVRNLASGIGGTANRPEFGGTTPTTVAATAAVASTAAMAEAATATATATAAATARKGAGVVWLEGDDGPGAGEGHKRSQPGAEGGISSGSGSGSGSGSATVRGNHLSRFRPSHHHTQGGRITKTRHRPSSSATENYIIGNSSISTSGSRSCSGISPSSPPPLSRPFSPRSMGATLKTTTPPPPPPTTTTRRTTRQSKTSSPPSSSPPTIISRSNSNSSHSTSLSVSPPASAHSSSSKMSSVSTRPLPLSAPAPTSTTTSTMIDQDPPVLSFWGPDPVPLPSRFARIKSNLIAGHETELRACWSRLIAALRTETEHIEGLGAHLIPSIEFADVDDPAQASRFGHDLRRYGVGVVRKVVPKSDTDTAMHETVKYLETKRDAKAPPQDPTCFDFFWTPAQVRSRAHPSVLRTQRFMMGLWDTSAENRLVTQLPITYVDRIRIHGAGDEQPNETKFPLTEPPQSADDWINALQSSAGIIAQVDNGSLERWEPDGYQRGGTYNNVFNGRWEEYDPWECNSRVTATMDLYNGYGACTIFRMFQGVLALSTIEPGMIRLLPSPKLATAYYLLRPFFSPIKPAPERRSGPEWEAYLAPENWELEQNPDTIIHGAVPGHAQRITEHWHPHLHLRGSMITLPTLQPGDYIFWHPDLPYHISSNNHGLKTPSSRDEISMLVYIPAAPLTQTNALYLARQRKAFQRGHPGPDFDSSGRGFAGEDTDESRPGEKEIAQVGGPAALQAMGLAPWEAACTRACTPPSSDKSKPKDAEDAEMVDSEKAAAAQDAKTKDANGLPFKSLASTPTGGSRAEAEVIRLANIILFPDRSMMGYSV